MDNVAAAAAEAFNQTVDAQYPAMLAQREAMLGGVDLGSLAGLSVGEASAEPVAPSVPNVQTPDLGNGIA